jgi:hypothetical protein
MIRIEGIPVLAANLMAKLKLMATRLSSPANRQRTLRRRVYSNNNKSDRHPEVRVPAVA